MMVYHIQNTPHSVDACSRVPLNEKRAKKTMKSEGGLLPGWAKKMANERLEIISGLLFSLKTTTFDAHTSQPGTRHHAKQLKTKPIHLNMLGASLMKTKLSNQSLPLVI